MSTEPTTIQRGSIPTANQSATDGPTAAIKTTALGKRYGSTVALDGLSIEVPRGEIYGFLGPNGAGKTTTIRLLLGLHWPTAGNAALFGIDATRDPVRAHTRVAFVAGEPALWPALTVAETLELLGNLHRRVDRRYRDELITRFNLDPSKRVRALSKGNRQKVELIAALATRAELLLLDEPTSGLDPLMALAFRESITEARERGQTVFLSSHILSEVEALCDRVGILREGRLIDQGTLSELRHLSAQTVEARFAGPVPAMPDLAGVTAHQTDDHTLHLEVARADGAMNALLRFLADQKLSDLTVREPSLEEIFVHHYATHDANADTPRLA